MPTAASSRANPAKQPNKAVLSRREVVVLVRRCSIVITLWSDSFGSTSAAPARAGARILRSERPSVSQRNTHRVEVIEGNRRPRNRRHLARLSPAEVDRWPALDIHHRYARKLSERQRIRSGGRLHAGQRPQP